MGTPFREVNASHGASRPIVWAVPAELNVAIGVALLRDSDRWYGFATVMRWCGSWLTVDPRLDHRRVVLGWGSPM